MTLFPKVCMVEEISSGFGENLLERNGVLYMKCHSHRQ